MYELEKEDVESKNLTWEYIITKATNYYKFVVIIKNFFRHYESTNCTLKITNFKFSAQQKKKPW